MDEIRPIAHVPGRKLMRNGKPVRKPEAMEEDLETTLSDAN
jgi:hypothetical protein